MKNFFWVVLISLLAGCEKTITLNPQSRQPLLVVDGSIENGKAPVVFLSTSLDYFGQINAQILLSSLVTGAKVTLTDGTVTSELKEYSQSLGSGYSLIYYTTDTLNPAGEIMGAPGRTYQLSIQYNNQNYTSITTLPLIVKKIDSLWWKPALFTDDTTRVVLMSKFTDPPGYGNFIRYSTRVNSGQFLPGQFSVFDDQVIDGTTYSIQVDQGVDRNNPPEQKDYGYFKSGDTITVRFANIDKATYDFWRTLEFGYSNVGNPFSSPTKVLGNVSNNALGAFCGYGAQYKTLIVPK